MPDARAPVVVGVGQVSQHAAPDVARPPIDLLADAARTADADTRAPRSLIARADAIAVVSIVSWHYPDPGAFLARTLGVSPRRTALSAIGGNGPQVLVDAFAEEIRRGDCDVVLIGGGESMHTRWRARREPRVHLTWDTGDDAPCGWVIGDDRPPSTDHELAHLANAPTLVYPLFETALRARLGHDVEEHQRHVSELWSRFSAVAAANPDAWSRDRFTAEQIRTVSAQNRMVCFPYPKLMCANIDVDQAAALLLCSYEAAHAAGVPDDRMVFLHAAAEAHDHWFVGERATLTDSPAIAAAARAALAPAGIDDVAHIDLYSCFASAVEVACRAIGLAPDDARGLTVTGGLGFAGGPVNNYPTHAIARMVDVLRADPGSLGLTTALGWYLTKHTAALWSTQPPDRPFETRLVQDAVDAQPRVAEAGLLDGEEVTIEATSVAFERDGSPHVGIVTTRTADGSRAFANVRDVDTLHAMTVEPFEGRRARVTNDGSTNMLAL